MTNIICSGALFYTLDTQRFLFLHRVQSKQNNVWGLVGGTNENEEIPFQALQREIKEEIGDVLFSVVNLARHLDIPAEDMLRKANRKFVRRFTQVEEKLESKGKKLEDSSLEEMDEVWKQIKKKE